MSSGRGTLTLLATAGALGAVGVPGAQAADSSPCGPQVVKSWSSEKVQQCPLIDPLPPDGWVPVYAQPVAVPAGQSPPAPAGWLHGVDNQFFVCDRRVPDADYHHPSAGTHHTWWAYTQTDGSPTWGWVPEVYFKGGADDEPDAGLRRCPSTPAPPPTPGPGPGSGTTPPAPLPPSPPPDASCAPEPAITGGTATLEAGSVRVPRRAPKVAPRPRTRLTVGFGTATQVTGVLRDAAGTPIADASLCVVSRPDDQSGPYLPLRRVTTGPDGSYAVPVPTGPSREILAIYRPGEFAVVGRTLVKVKPSLTARAHRRSLRNGQVLVITGRLRGGPFPKRGVTLNLQAVRDGRWAGFADPFRTDAEGHFRFRYRFTRTLGVQRYSMRIRAGAQAGYPYVSGFSKRMSIRVTGA
jgi:hypothetical protein